MRWSKVQEFAQSHGLELYTPMCGYHKMMQIIDPAAQKHWWTSNKASVAYQSLLSIVQQRQLAKTPDKEMIAQGQEAKAFFN